MKLMIDDADAGVMMMMQMMKMMMILAMLAMMMLSMKKTMTCTAIVHLKYYQRWVGLLCSCSFRGKVWESGGSVTVGRAG
jgi:hypothetical protein